MKHAHLISMLLLAGLPGLGTGCDDDAGPGAELVAPRPPAAPRTQSPLPDGHVPILPADSDPGDPGPIEAVGEGEGEAGDPRPSPDLAGRTARRLSVDALRRSIPALFDGLRWTLTVRQAGRPVEMDLFDALGRTLGEPDYIEVTEENADPSALFAKFMDDMAGSVCRQAVERDGAGGADGLVIRHPDDPDENLRFLRLKFHSIHVPADAREGIEGLRGLYDDLLADTADPGEAWFGVCVAMVTAPELMGY